VHAALRMYVMGGRALSENYWVRDKQAFTLEQGVRMLTHDNASAWGIADRGLLEAGYAADVVIFDEARIKPRMPTVEHDLPGGSRRLVQKADGIKATIVNGQLALEDGEPTGAYAGVVLRTRRRVGACLQANPRWGIRSRAAPVGACLQANPAGASAHAPRL
jgi:N-acyl-D-aspartate/D-glutamate deacylase